jgi:hypothetical protein
MRYVTDINPMHILIEIVPTPPVLTFSNKRPLEYPVIIIATGTDAAAA